VSDFVSLNDLKQLTLLDKGLAMVIHLPFRYSRQAMLRISIIDTPCKRTLLVEGKLIPPWTRELQRVAREASQHLEGRKLAIDLSSVTVISPEGESTLYELMRDGAKFSCGGVLTKHVLKQLARRSGSRFRDILTTVTAMIAI
jgi:hypothetical protein